MIEMPGAVEERLVRLAKLSPAREICGFIMTDWVILPVDNTSSNDYQFDMHEGQQLEVLMHQKLQIIGIYHSHPSGADFPSDRDIWAAPKNMRYWIVTTDGVFEWVIKNGIATTMVDSVHRGAEKVR